jgi:hypothetical protein
MRRDIALAAGIGVVSPRAADVAGALQDYEVADALTKEVDGGSESCEAGADDGDVVMGMTAITSFWTYCGHVGSLSSPSLDY